MNHLYAFPIIAVLFLTTICSADPIPANTTVNRRIEAQDLNDTLIVNAITANGNLNGNDRNPISDWIVGIIGSRPTEKPPQLDPPDHCDSCSCGIANKQKRIVGGQETEVNQYPWMALLTYSNRFYCGASLINDRYVMTAAHCVSGFNKDRIGVTLLEHDRSKPGETELIKRKVMRIIRHAGYSPTNFNNDIALLRLDREVKFTNVLKPVCMPSRGKSFSHLDGIATGWGATKEQGDISVNLQEVTVPILSNSECRKTGYGASRITDNMLCAGLKDGQKDSCQGDSGGPLHVVNDTIYQVVGVVSWGEGCAQPDYPGVYTRVNRYRTWIKSNTRDACYCED
ncbi:trypsin-1-like [Sitodiplosis mosellana]|uniref:trypsin-1-like n=1 Tax=Sitodiplosis mosellana TaxID=263140 RepID=UPI0024446C2F|nr:trypsin-1-like [Sitodiplosis mosellana]